MASTVTLNGTNYTIPATGDSSWGDNVSQYLVALGSGVLQKAGGIFTLTADVNFGTAFGVKSPYFTSTAANPAAAGVVRLASTDVINWRNNANSADVSLGKNTSDALTWGGNVIASSSGIVPVPAGGTGIASGTSGGIPYFSSGTTIASSGALAQYGVVIGGGAGASPVTLSAAAAGTILTGQGSANPSFSATPVLGVAGTTAGSIGLSGVGSGVVTIAVGNSAGTYNFNLPTSTGSAGQPLLSGGGGSASQTYGTLGFGAGGTGQITQQAAMDALAGTQSSGKYLRSDGTHTTLTTIQAGDVPTLNQNTSGTAAGLSATLAIASGGTNAITAAAAFNNLSPMTTLGDVIYGGASGAGTRLAGSISATKQFLTQTGNGAVSAAPAWGTIAAGDVPTLNQNTTGTAANITGTSNSTLTSLSALTSASTLATVGTIGTGVWQGTAVATGFGGTGVSSVTIAPAATAFAGWDANKNLSANNHIEGYATTATSGGTLTLTVGSAYQQYLTGSTTHTVALPLASSLVNGFQFLIVNQSSGVVTVQTSGTNVVQAMAANTVLLVTCVNSSGGTGLASWGWQYNSVQNSAVGGTVTSVAMSVPSFLSVSGSPITGAGTLAVTLSGTALPVLNGGTGQTTASGAFNALAPATAKGGLVAGSGTNTYGNLAVGTDNQALIADSSQTNGVRWTTLQQGAKNYVTYNNFENNATTGWSLAHSSLTSAFPSTVGSGGNSFSSAGGVHGGSAASGNLSTAIVSSGQLAGTYSLSLVSSAATTAGDMLISQSYTIDAEDQAKVMTFKFYYSVPTNGTANFSGTSSNSFGVAIYDLANNAWIMPAGVWNLVQSSGVGYCTGTFQTPSNMTGFQIALFNANATVGATTLYLDDFYVGPQTAPMGPAMTDWISFASGSAFASGGFTRLPGTVNGAFWRRVGDSMEIMCDYTASGAATGNIIFSIPGNYTIDTAKVYATSRSIGYAYSIITNSADAILELTNSTTVQFRTSQNVNGSTWGTSVPGTWANGSNISLYMMVPIVGWSSNTSMSADTDTRVVAMYAQGTPTGTLSGSFSAIVYPTMTNDTHGAYNATTGLYTVPVTGYYNISANARITATYTAGNGHSLGIARNGTVLKGAAWLAQTSLTATADVTVSMDAFFCNAGDTIGIQANSGGSSISFNSNSQFSYFTVNRVSGPAVVAATESVNAKYTSSSTAVGTSSAVAVFATKAYDTHGAYNSSTGIYTVPVSGKYRVASAIVSGTNVSSSVVNNGIYLQLYKNGSLDTNINDYIYPVASVALQQAVSGSTTVSCVAGDTLQINTQRDANVGSFSLSGNAGATWVTFERIGN